MLWTDILPSEADKQSQFEETEFNSDLIDELKARPSGAKDWTGKSKNNIVVYTNIVE